VVFTLRWASNSCTDVASIHTIVQYRNSFGVLSVVERATSVTLGEREKAVMLEQHSTGAGT
jgi:hypothetical protein